MVLEVLTSLASGCLAPTLVDVDQTSFDIFRTRVSKQPAWERKELQRRGACRVLTAKAL